MCIDFVQERTTHPQKEANLLVDFSEKKKKTHNTIGQKSSNRPSTFIYSSCLEICKFKVNPRTREMSQWTNKIQVTKISAMCYFQW